MNNVQTQSIVGRALESESNLESALRTHFAFGGICKAVVAEFVLSLEKSLQNELGDGWLIKNDMRGRELDLYAGLSVLKKQWSKYVIRLQQDLAGVGNIVLGIQKTAETHPAIDALKNKFDKEYRLGKAEPWWVWYQYLEEPYKNWNTLEMMLALYRKTDALDYIKRQFMTVARMSEQTLDELAVS